MSNEVRNRFSPRVPVTINFEETGRRAKQSFKDECDINNIMRKYARTGIISHVNRYEAFYGDVADMPQDYQSALEQIRATQEMFMALPASLRKRFDNDPGKYLAFAMDSSNLEQMRELGLLRPAEPASGGASPEIADGGEGGGAPGASTE